MKINPIAAWTDEDMQNYIDANDVLVNPLVFEGYPSIGCAPCTAKPVEGADPRSGRWAGCRRRNAGCTLRDSFVRPIPPGSDPDGARECRSAIGGIGT